MVGKKQPFYDWLDLEMLNPEKYGKLKTVQLMTNQGYSAFQIGLFLDLSERQIFRIRKELKLRNKMEGRA